jgi:hypothetical protein
MKTANHRQDYDDDGSDDEYGHYAEDAYDDCPAAQKPKGKKPKSQPAPAPDHRHTTRATCPALNNLQKLLKMPSDQLGQHSGIKDVETYREKLGRAVGVLSTGGSDDSRLPRSCGGGQTSFDDSSCPSVAGSHFLPGARKHDLVLQSTFGINGAERGDGITMWMEVRNQYQDFGDWGYASYWIWIAVNKPVTENDPHHPFRCRARWDDPKRENVLTSGEIVAVNPATTAMVNLIANPRCSPAYRARLWGAMGELWD